MVHAIEHQYPKVLNVGNWVGDECQQGFYSFHYIGENSDQKLIDGTGAETITDLLIPWDHKLNFISISKEGADSDTIEIRYIPAGQQDLAYEILYSATTTAKSILIELGSAYENLGGATLRFVITGTSGKWLVPRVNILFVEVPPST